jgi:hypothetical protein
VLVFQAGKFMRQHQDEQNSQCSGNSHCGFAELVGCRALESDALHGQMGCTDENGFELWN